jgi:hypothetical protein
MKEIARGVLVGLANGGSAAHANRNSKRVTLSFERTEYADRSEFCGKATPRLQVTYELHRMGKPSMQGRCGATRMCDFNRH